MTSVGETLRRERLKRKLDFDQISHELKISARFLEAIENDQYQKLPGGVFAKSFVRQYARLLGLDEEELAGQVPGALPSDPPQFLEKVKPTYVAPIQVPRVEEWRTVGDKGFRWSGSLSAAVMVVVAMLVCSAVYAWLQRPKSPATTLSTAPAHSAPQSAPVPAATAPAIAPAPVSAESTPAPVQVAGQVPADPNTAGQKPAAPKLPTPGTAELQGATPHPATPSPATPNPDATVHVEITAEEPVWVLARTDGKYAFSGTLSVGETRLVEGVKDVVLRLGNAGGVAISLNGKPVGAVGPKGQPRTLQLTSGGFQIVPAAKPPAAPLDRL